MWTFIWAVTIALFLPFGLVVATWLEPETGDLAAPARRCTSLRRADGQPPPP
ncbi:cytochrome bd-I oxidase subunit CydX [Inquilinus sp. OTU3971]|uniref:cytochrome bd-I oxidase subunit CydX n=1 Tax=Inquilinus sp. OTU3971 TaxID=3043855 RepID=UPI00313C6555